MKLPLDITFKNMESSPTLTADIQEKTDKLELFYGDIIHCSVVLEAQHTDDHKGNVYHCRIDICVPGEEIVVNQSPQEKQSNEDAYTAIRDAFNAAKRQLDHFAEKWHAHSA